MYRAALLAGPSPDVPELDDDDIDDLEEAADDEIEKVEEEVLDQATAARTAEELRAEIASLVILEKTANDVRRSGDDRKWVELSGLLHETFEHIASTEPTSAPGTTAGKKLVIFTEHWDTLSYLYMGSAPTAGAAHRGLEVRRVTLGCVMPGEPPAIFGDALRRLAGAATYLYQDGTRVWYATQPTVTKLAEDRAEHLKREPDKVYAALDDRIRDDARKAGDFARVHAFARSAADVPDQDARLVVLPAEHVYSRRMASVRPRSPRRHCWSLVATARAFFATAWCSSRRTRRGCRISTTPCADTWHGSPLLARPTCWTLANTSAGRQRPS